MTTRDPLGGDPLGGDVLGGVMPSLRRTTNSDIDSRIARLRAARNKQRAATEAREQLGFVREQEAAANRLKAQAQETATSLNLDPKEEHSFLERVTRVLDTPSRVFTRPLMGTMLAGIFSAMPGEQTGEAELRRALIEGQVGHNPLSIFFNREHADGLREALKKTKLPWGVYTAMEVGLDPINFIPVGRIAKPGVQLGRRFIKGKPEAVVKTAAKKKGRIRVVDQLSLEDSVNLSDASGTRLSKIAKSLGKVPVVRQVVGTLSPRTLGDSPIGRVTVGYMTMLHTGGSLADIAVSRLAAKKNPFTIDMDTGVVSGLSFKGKPPAEGLQWGDLFQDYKRRKITSKYRLTTQQKEYIDEAHEITREVREFAEANGIKLNEFGLEPGQMFMPRQLIGKEGVDYIQGISKKPYNFRNYLEKSRYWQTMAESVGEGNRYLNDPVAVIKAHVTGMYRVHAEFEFDKALKGLKNADGTSAVEAFNSPGINSALGKLDARKRQRQALSKVNTFLTTVKGGGRIDQMLGKAVVDLPTVPFIRETLGAPGERFIRELKRIQDLPAGKAKEDAVTALRAEIKQGIDEAKVLRLKAGDEVARAQAAREAELRQTKARISRPGEGFGKLWFDKQDVADFDGFIRRNPERTNSLLRQFNSVGAAGRALTAGLDFGGAMIQGFPTLVTRPDIWARSQATALRAMLRPRVHAQWKAKNAEGLQRMANYGGAVSRSEYFEAAQQGGILTRIPIVGKGVGAGDGFQGLLAHAGAGFNAFGDVARLNLFEGMEPMVAAKVAILARKRGVVEGSPEYTQLLDKGLTELGEHVSKMTGTVSNASLGISATQAEIERAVFFAPRYLRATVGLVADVVQGGIRGQQARSSMAKMLAGGVISYYGLATALGQEAKLDPTRGDFLTVEFEGNRVGFGSAWISLARTMAKIYKQADDIQGGEDEWTKVMSLDPNDSMLAQFVRFKAAPLTGVGWDLATGRDAIGRPVGNPLVEPFQFSKGMARRLLPISLQGLLEEDYVDDDEPLESELTGVVGDFFGLRTHPTSFFQERTDRRNDLARASGAESWDQLDPLRQRLISERDPRLGQLDQAVRKWNIERGDETQVLIQELFDETDSLRTDYMKDLTEFEEAWRDGEGTGKDFRLALKVTGTKLGAKYDQIYKNSGRYAPALAELRGRSDAVQGNLLPGADAESIEQVAKHEYIMRFVVGDEEFDNNGNKVNLEDSFGQFNYTERDRRERDMITRYGEPVYNNVRLAFDKSATLPPAVRELRELRDLFSPYWQVGERIAERVGLTEQWQRYKEIANTVEGDELLVQYPALDRIGDQERAARKVMRKQSPLLDAFLLRYGYTTTAENVEVTRRGKAFVQNIDNDIQAAFPITS